MYLHECMVLDFFLCIAQDHCHGHVQHHTGLSLRLVPGLPAISPSGRHFCLQEEAQLVKVGGDGKVIEEIKVFPVKGAGPKALFLALGGEIPSIVPAEALKRGAKDQLPIP